MLTMSWTSLLGSYQSARYVRYPIRGKGTDNPVQAGWIRLWISSGTSGGNRCVWITHGLFHSLSTAFPQGFAYISRVFPRVFPQKGFSGRLGISPSSYRDFRLSGHGYRRTFAVVKQFTCLVSVERDRLRERAKLYIYICGERDPKTKGEKENPPVPATVSGDFI